MAKEKLKVGDLVYLSERFWQGEAKYVKALDGYSRKDIVGCIYKIEDHDLNVFGELMRVEWQHSDLMPNGWLRWAAGNLERVSE